MLTKHCSPLVNPYSPDFLYAYQALFPTGEPIQPRFPLCLPSIVPHWWTHTAQISSMLTKHCSPLVNPYSPDFLYAYQALFPTGEPIQPRFPLCLPSIVPHWWTHTAQISSMLTKHCSPLVNPYNPDFLYAYQALFPTGEPIQPRFPLCLPSIVPHWWTHTAQISSMLTKHCSPLVNPYSPDFLYAYQALFPTGEPIQPRFPLCLPSIVPHWWTHTTKISAMLTTRVVHIKWHLSKMDLSRTF